MSMNALADVTYYAQKLSEENEQVGWHESLIGIWWRNADGMHLEEEWVWIDEEPYDRFNTDGIYTCYSFDMLTQRILKIGCKRNKPCIIGSVTG